MTDVKTWMEVPKAAIKAAFVALPKAKSFLLAIGEEVDAPVYYNPDADVFAYDIPLPVKHASVTTDKMNDVSGVWLLVKTAGFNPTAHDVFGPAANLGGWKPNAVTKALGGPSTLTAGLGSGLLGAGLGYGAGWIADRLLFKDKRLPGEKSRLPWVGAALGGLAGAAPAAWAGYRGWFKDPSGLSAAARSAGPYTDTPAPAKISSTTSVKDLVDMLMEEFPQQSLHEKSADFAYNAGFNQVIPVDQFNKVIWQDPRTPANMRAATSGLIQGASALRSGSERISPTDVARIAVGMGAGYASGLVVGKTLGALAGISDSAQQSLQQAGVWSGIINNVVPLAYG